MIDKEKLENIEDPEIKALMERMSEFVYPKFEEFREKISSDKPNIMKMLKIAKDFTKTLKEDYKVKYDRDMEEDIKKVNEYMGVSTSPSDILKMFKGI
jgi:hypothetical protein